MAIMRVSFVPPPRLVGMFPDTMTSQPSIRQASSPPCQLLLQLTPEGGQTIVDDRDPRSILDQVSVDDIGADAMQTGCQPHRLISIDVAHRGQRRHRPRQPLQFRSAAREAPQAWS